MARSQASRNSPPPPPRRNWWRLTAFVVGATLLGVAAYALGSKTGLGAHSSGASASPSTSASASVAANKFGPQVVSEKRIIGLPEELGHPVFWAGKATADQRYELTISADGAVAIRYLDVADTTGAAGALAVATFARKDAFQVLTEEAGRPGTTVATPAPNSLVVPDAEDKRSGFLGREGVDYVAQVFHPAAGKAWELLSSGKITLIGATG